MYCIIEHSAKCISVFSPCLLCLYFYMSIQWKNQLQYQFTFTPHNTGKLSCQKTGWSRYLKRI